jgi:hypothetical protein
MAMATEWIAGSSPAMTRDTGHIKGYRYFKGKKLSSFSVSIAIDERTW